MQCFYKEKRRKPWKALSSFASYPTLSIIIIQPSINEVRHTKTQYCAYPKLEVHAHKPHSIHSKLNIPISLILLIQRLNLPFFYLGQALLLASSLLFLLHPSPHKIQQARCDQKYPSEKKPIKICTNRRKTQKGTGKIPVLILQFFMFFVFILLTIVLHNLHLLLDFPHRESFLSFTLSSLSFLFSHLKYFSPCDT